MKAITKALTDKSVQVHHLDYCLRRTIEEMAELTQVISKIDRPDVDQDELLNRLAEEYCGVVITLEYVEKMLDDETINEHMVSQLNKLRKAIYVKGCS